MEEIWGGGREEGSGGEQRQAGGGRSTYNSSPYIPSALLGCTGTEPRYDQT